MAKIEFSVGRDYLGFNPANPYPPKKRKIISGSYISLSKPVKILLF
jgi:hypothetical protein